MKKKKSWRRRIFKLFLPLLNRTRADVLPNLRYMESRGILFQDELEIFEGALTISHARVRDIMVHEANMVSLVIDEHPKAFLPKIIQSSHSRFPVYDLGRKKIIGLLLAKDLLPWLDQNSWQNFNLKKIIRKISFVPESKRLTVLLDDFRNNRSHMAIVVDEFNNVAGLVTIEDVLEQIVGEIEDEHDLQVTVHDYLSYIPGEARSYLVKADMPLNLFNNFFEANFSDEDMDTVGGLVLRACKELPKVGTSIELNNWQISVTRADERRIIELKMINLIKA